MAEPDECVSCSADITKLSEARQYYSTKLVGAHKISSHDKRVDIVFEAESTHIFSEAVDDIAAIAEADLVTKNIGGGRRECRQFCLDRAKLMDRVLSAISGHTRCVLDKGQPSRANLKLFGQKMDCGRHMCVVLRPGAGNSYVCLTAYPVNEEAYRQASWQRPARFPR